MCMLIVLLSAVVSTFALQVNDIALCENVGLMASVSPNSACYAAVTSFLP